VEAEELKGEKEPAHYAATGIFQMEIVRPHPPRAPRAQLGILMTDLIILVAGYGASRTSAFQWFLLNASSGSRRAIWRIGWKIDIVSRLCFSMFGRRTNGT
jgi:hypothetical protein